MSPFEIGEGGCRQCDRLRAELVQYEKVQRECAMRAENVLQKLYERMWFREGLASEGWAIEVIDGAITAAVAKETERCARVAMKSNPCSGMMCGCDEPKRIAAAIRAR
jgi:hypothetical protein